MGITTRSVGTIKLYRKIDGAQTGLFPAKAGPTKTARAVSGTGFSREAFDVLLTK